MFCLSKDKSTMLNRVVDGLKIDCVVHSLTLLFSSQYLTEESRRVISRDFVVKHNYKTMNGLKLSLISEKKTYEYFFLYSSIVHT